MKTILTAVSLAAIIILGIYTWMQHDSAELFEREAQERHGQSGAIGGNLAGSVE